MSFAKRYLDGRRENTPAAVDDSGKIINAGFDESEGVQKVATLVWNASLLQWERGTGSASGGGSSGVPPTTRRIDTGALITYVGQATPGTAETSVGWAIQKITFDTLGSATAVLFASGAWSNRAALSYT